MNISTKPYLIRALYEWCLDSSYTPYLAVWVNEYTRVPPQYVQDNQIVLSISTTATKDLMIDNDWISFHARFGGVAQEVWVPIGHVMSIFAKETGEGMGFEVEAWQPDNNAAADTADSSEKTEATAEPKKKILKLVK